MNRSRGIMEEVVFRKNDDLQRELRKIARELKALGFSQTRAAMLLSAADYIDAIEPLAKAGQAVQLA